MIRRITLPLLVESQNSTDRMHWRTRHRLKNIWKVSLYSAVGYVERPACRMAVTIESFRPRLITDHANLVGGCKMVIDAIRDAGLIHDDADKWMIAAYVQHLRSHPANPFPGHACTRITVEPMPEISS
jgi:hypothetical protein